MITALRSPDYRPPPYTTPGDYRDWHPAHEVRAALTVALAAPFVQPGSVVADLSCGNGLIASALAEKAGTTPILGDVAPGWPITGDLVDTIENVGPVDVFVLTETLEHLPDPAAVLAGIQADVLVLSTPVEAWDDREPQHLWAWDRQWVSVLAAAVLGKLAGVHLAGRILGWSRGEASIIGWLLQTKALIMIIFSNVLLDKQIITSTTFTALLLMAVGSTMLTIPVVAPMLKRMPDIRQRLR